jgi:hypothetical protein
MDLQAMSSVVDLDPKLLHDSFRIRVVRIRNEFEVKLL